MNHSKNPLRLNVGHLFNKPIGSLREIPLAFETIEIDDLLAKDLGGVVRISRTREGLLLQVEAGAKLRTTCARCLNEFDLRVHAKFEELYQFPSRHREETDLILPEDGYLDLTPLFRESLILAMPIKRLCKTDCKGLCAICGVNLNETTCEHHLNEERSPSEQEQSEEAV